MRHWFRDQSFRSLVKNTSYLAVSKGVAAVAGLATLAFAGRGLGLAQFGILVLIVSYVQAASGLTKFQSWQMIIRYGGAGLATGKDSQFRRAVGFGLGLDISSGLVGFLIAIALLPLIGPWLGIPKQYLALTLAYCLLVLTMGAATPIGILRSLDRFDLISWQGTTYPIARAILAGIAWGADAPFQAYVAIWFATDLGGDLYLWFLARRELRRRRLNHGIRPTLRPRDLPGAWAFAIQANLAGSLAVAWGPIARLIVGGMLGPASAGLYRVAATLADSAQKPADLLSKAYYPEVVRMDFATKHPWKLMLRGTALAGAFGLLSALIIVIAGRPLLGALFGPDFAGAYPILLILVIIPLIGVLSFPLPSMLYALDRPDAPLKARLVGTTLYLAIVVPMTLQWEAAGAAAAYVVSYAAMVATLALQLRSVYRRVRIK